MARDLCYHIKMARGQTEWSWDETWDEVWEEVSRGSNLFKGEEKVYGVGERGEVTAEGLHSSLAQRREGLWVTALGLHSSLAQARETG